MRLCKTCGGILYPGDAAHFCAQSVKVDLLNEQRRMLDRIAELETALRQIATGAEDDHDGFTYGEIAEVARKALRL